MPSAPVHCGRTPTNRWASKFLTPLKQILMLLYKRYGICAIKLFKKMILNLRAFKIKARFKMFTFELGTTLKLSQTSVNFCLSWSLNSTLNGMVLNIKIKCRNSNCRNIVWRKLFTFGLSFFLRSPVYASMHPLWYNWRTSDSAHAFDAVCFVAPCSLA